MALAMTSTSHTPHEIVDLHRLLALREAEIARQSAELQARDLLIEQLKLQLANFRRHRFWREVRGARKDHRSVGTGTGGCGEGSSTSSTGTAGGSI